MTTVIKNPFTANVATSVTDMSDYINELYDRQLAARRAALAAAYDSKVAVQEAEESALDPAYREAKNRIASAAATEQRNFDEYANAAGLGSGAAAQGRLSRSVALQHDLNALETSRAQAHADFSAERSGLAAEYAEAVAEAEAEGNAERARALYQEGVRVQEAKDEATRYNNDLAYKLMTALASAAWPPARRAPEAPAAAPLPPREARRGRRLRPRPPRARRTPRASPVSSRRWRSPAHRTPISSRTPRATG